MTTKFYTYKHLLEILQKLSEEELDSRFIYNNDNTTIEIIIPHGPMLFRKRDNKYVIEEAKSTKRDGWVV